MATDNPVVSQADAGAIWNRVLEYLRSCVSGEAFDTWLSPTKGRELKGDVIEVEVPTSFFVEWLSQRYAANIKTALAAVCARPLSVSFRPRGQDDIARLHEHRTRSPWKITDSPSYSARSAYRLKPNYTFANFVVGESSRLACAAARSVAERPGVAYNPLFIYGGPGLGKTHLLHAIGNHLLSERGDKAKILYVAAETLFLEFIQAIEKDTRLEFKNKYRCLGLLLLDDVHYLVGKERLQEEIFHIFNHLHNAGSQVVFTSDRPPKEIPTLEERLTSRLGSGLVVDIQPPDLETRIAILHHKAALEGLSLPPEVAHYVASRVKSNVRELEGCLVRISAMSSLAGEPVSLALAEKALKDLLPPEQTPSADAVITKTAEVFGVPAAAIRGPSRTKQLALARQAAMFALRHKLGLSLKEIGTMFGGRDHTTVMHALDKIQSLCTTDPTVASKIERIMSGITGA